MKNANKIYAFLLISHLALVISCKHSRNQSILTNQPTTKNTVDELIGSDKTLVCHKMKRKQYEVIEIDEISLDNHLRHGDKVIIGKGCFTFQGYAYNGVHKHKFTIISFENGKILGHGIKLNHTDPGQESIITGVYDSLGNYSLRLDYIKSNIGYYSDLTIPIDCSNVGVGEYHDIRGRTGQILITYGCGE